VIFNRHVFLFQLCGWWQKKKETVIVSDHARRPEIEAAYTRSARPASSGHRAAVKKLLAAWAPQISEKPCALVFSGWAVDAMFIVPSLIGAQTGICRPHDPGPPSGLLYTTTPESKPPASCSDRRDPVLVLRPAVQEANRRLFRRVPRI